ncbi:MAG: hypothetical protein AAF721_21190, partial [Myxococcota bacterium]
AETLADDHPDLALSRHNLSMALLKLDRHAEALPLLRAAWSVRNKHPSPASRGATAHLLARALAADPAGRAEALTVAATAMAAYEEAGPSVADKREELTASIEAWRAELAEPPAESPAASRAEE